MGSLFSKKVPPTCKPRDEKRVVAASQHIEPIREALEALGDKIQGKIFLAPKDNSEFLLGGDENSDGYHAQRERPFYFNDCNYPSAIVVVESPEDVAEVIKGIQNFDKEKYRLCIAGGCHSSFCMVDNTIVVDLCKLNAVSVDTETKTISIAGGAKILDAHKALRGTGYGFATGTNSDTGISGLTMAGGAGYLGPQAGFACDTVVQAKVVLPSGKIVTATDTNEYKDLLRALRGGGGNFGIVVEWTFKLYDVTNAFGGTVVHFAPTMASVKTVLSNYIDILHNTDDLPDAAGNICAMPAGAPVFISVATMIGDEVKDAKSYTDIPFLSKVSNLGAWFRLSNDLGPKDYIDEIATLLEDVQQRTYGTAVGAMVYSIDEAIQDALIHFTRVDYPTKNAKPTILVMSLAGEMRRNDGSKSSITHRKAEAWIILDAGWTPEATAEEVELVKDWAKRAKQKLVDLGGEDGPHNFCDSDGRRIKFFTDEQREFLEQTKQKYDPTNLLNVNRNIVIKTTC